MPRLWSGLQAIPLIDPALVDEAIRRFKVAGVDYLSNAAPPSYPDGLDTEAQPTFALY